MFQNLGFHWAQQNKTSKEKNIIVLKSEVISCRNFLRMGVTAARFTVRIVRISLEWTEVQD